MKDRLALIRALKKHLVTKYGDEVEEVILFGSQAAGNAKSYSDYDVLIVLNQPYTVEDENQILDLCYEINLQYDILLDVHLISMDELSALRGKQPIYANALKNGIRA